MSESTLRELILSEHRRAELQRLDSGLPGCGCSDCQQLYREINLAKYGSRVTESGGNVLIKESKEAVIRQSWGAVFQYFDGWAWGIAADGRTICLGREDAVKAAVANPKLRSGYEDIDAIIELERSSIIKKEGDYGEQTISTRGQRIIRTGGVRARPARNAKHEQVNTGHITARKGLSLRKVKYAGKSLPGF